MNTNILTQQFQYYLNHKKEFLSKYENKYLVIANNMVVATYDDAAHAVHWSRKQFKPGEFLIQLCTPDDSTYTVSACSKIII